MTAPREDGQGPFLAMKKALRHAGLKPSSVDYVNAHATSTPLGDAAENRAIKDLLLSEHGKEKATDVNISSTKGAVGHLLGAAGSVEAIFTILGLHNVSINSNSLKLLLMASEYPPPNPQSREPRRSARRLRLQLRPPHSTAKRDPGGTIQQLWIWRHKCLALF